MIFIVRLQYGIQSKRMPIQAITTRPAFHLYLVIILLVFSCIATLFFEAGCDLDEPTSPGQLVSLEDKQAFTPDIMIDKDGDAHIIWRGGDWQLWYAKLSTIGTYLVPPKQLTDSTDIRFPKMAIDLAGTIHIVAQSKDYTSFLIYYQVSNDGSEVTSNAFRMFNNLTVLEEDYRWPCIALNPTTQLPVVASQTYVHVNEALGELASYFRYAITVVPLNAKGDPIIAERWDPYVFYSGREFEEERAKYPAIAVDSAGKIHCAWEHKEPDWLGYAIAHATFSQHFLEVSPERMVNQSKGGPEISSDGEFVDIVWTTTDGSVEWARINQSGLVSGSAVVSDLNSLAERPTIDSGFGRVICAWTDNRKNVSQIYSREVIPIHPPDILISPSNAFNVSLKIRSENRVDYVWQENSTRVNQIYYDSLELDGEEN